jgi:hypothetical protein
MRFVLAMMATVTNGGIVQVSLKRNRTQLSFSFQEEGVGVRGIRMAPSKERTVNLYFPDGLVNESTLQGIKKWGSEMRNSMLQLTDLIPSTSEKDVFEAIPFIATPEVARGGYLFCRYNIQISEFAVVKYRPDLDSEWKTKIDADPLRACAILHIKRLSLVKSALGGVDYTQWHKNDFVEMNSREPCPSMRNVKLCQSEIQLKVCPEVVCNEIHFMLPNKIADGTQRAALVYDLSAAIAKGEPIPEIQKSGLEAVVRQGHVECRASGIPDAVAHVEGLPRLVSATKAQSYCSIAYEYLRGKPMLSQLVFDISP